MNQGIHTEGEVTHIGNTNNSQHIFSFIYFKGDRLLGIAYPGLDFH